MAAENVSELPAGAGAMYLVALFVAVVGGLVS